MQFHSITEVGYVEDILTPDDEWITNTQRCIHSKKQCLASPEKQAVMDMITHQRQKHKLRTRKYYIMISLSVPGL